MTTAKSPEFEDLLREAFAPVEPPGTTACAALVILRVRTQAKRRSAQGRGIGGVAQRSLRSATAEARRLFDAGRKR
ncbi:MAG: hypothetical protein NTV40_01910 [Solirubrobacterales bacterium]|nr:hypothetical protein [Solirubrobacterales bacterium]